MHKFFIAIHLFVAKNRLIAIGMALAFLALFGFFAMQIRFEEDITRLIPKNERTDEAAKVLRQLNFSDKITVIINRDMSDGKLEDLSQTATIFLDSLQSCNDYIKGVQGKVDDENIQETFGFVYDNLPLFLNEKDYEKLSIKLNRDSIAAIVQANYRSIISPSGLVTKDFVLKDPLGMSLIGLKKLRQLGMGDDFLLQDGFVMTKDSSKVLLFINPKFAGNETKENTAFVDRLNSIKDNLNTASKGRTTIEYFGSIPIAVANAKQIKSDIQTTTIVALGLLMLIFIIYYRRLYIPLIILIPTIFGALFAVALLYFLRGTISAISLSIGSILLGVTIDYALHILTHYKHNSDIRVLYKDITMPLIMSSSTTAVAFLCLLFVNSDALKDLGIFAAVSVMVTSVFSLLIIPHLYKPSASAAEADHNTALDKLAGFSFHKNRPLIILSIFVITASFFTFNKVVFNNDISQLNYVPDDIKHAEKSLEASTSLTSKSLYLATYGNTPDEVLQKNSALAQSLEKDKAGKKLLSYSTVGNIVLSEKEQQERIARWNAFWQGRKENTVQLFAEEGTKLGFKPDAYQPFFTHLQKNFMPVSLQDYLNVKTLYLNEFISQKDGFYTATSVVKVAPEQRDALVNELQKKQGLVVIDRQQMNETFLGGLRDDFNTLINYSFVALLLILYIFFRRVELVMIASIPIIITGIVTTGIMGMFGIELNIFSTIVCTLVFGHGVDFSIFMTSALQKEYTYGRNEMATYRTSILLAVLTTVLGIGALVFAGHPALKSISSVSLIGVFAALVITFIFYPILFRFFLTHRVKKGKSPYQFRTLVHSIFSFIYYGLGGFLLSIFSLVFINLIPAKKHWKMKVFRYLMSKFMKSVLYTNPFTSKRIINPHNETFDKPAVIIANHTSFLDILAVGMLSPKIIYLVSDWVYNSPVFGIGVKLAGFYPVSQGLEGGVEHLRKKVKQGYSLVIFPEGTRSTTNQIHRFHKGAFYLAEEFGLDIVPIIIHGNSEVLPKGDFIIEDGSIDVHILPRITADDKSLGENYAARTRNLTKWFREQFAAIRKAGEGPDYFRRIIMNSFVYKEPEIVKAVKQNFYKSKNIFNKLNGYIGSKATILHFAADYGELDVLLALQEPQRKIVSYIADEDKRDVARTSYIKRKRDIAYTNMPAPEGSFDIVLITDAAANVPATVIENTERIVIAGEAMAKNMIFEEFMAEYEEEGFRILKRA
ncbi:1-acyl-sn-glycerol-3-phosphate acyltransferase [Flavobacterium sp. J372]|uniref:1-acyl-sn-glycerol-3-phosphate acyltransferase n=1 Tax=Flavobacterium sp. J372 TaxID=2898436 RepID=UPI002150D9BF|nr:1-acyl-sn-glycerol-3-phosphate acyltransferase [Flavobacterium sp. J372]MCR5861385.1 1-acyl-sn-glycerol-3-phosphate acyltransferase [Flavobacterium sp. J372]